MAYQLAKTDRPYYEAKTKAVKKPAYLEWLHMLPCVITGKYGVEAAHISFANTRWGCWGRGKGTKVPDLFALPLAPEIHALQHSGKLGTEQAFWAHHGIDPHELCVVLWAIFSAYESASVERATARINQQLGAMGRLKNRETV